MTARNFTCERLYFYRDATASFSLTTRRVHCKLGLRESSSPRMTLKEKKWAQYITNKRRGTNAILFDEPLIAHDYLDRRNYERF